MCVSQTFSTSSICGRRNAGSEAGRIQPAAKKYRALASAGMPALILPNWGLIRAVIAVGCIYRMHGNSVTNGEEVCIPI
jgi:hypothetical protein